MREYLPTLLPRGKWSADTPSLGVGDIVLVMNAQTPRNVWRKGVIISVFPGVDGVVSVAKIKIAYGETIRPVHKLIVIKRAHEVQEQ